MQGQLTIEWINEKVGSLYISNLQMSEELKRLFEENIELKKKLSGSEKEA
jgi:hypothetical protein